ncbi:MAG: SHOCT domain-containing protein [Coriobacteriia bacterium]|nr:SHOCT domain-containing protein [Coriobacteriia bacterium]
MMYGRGFGHGYGPGMMGGGGWFGGILVLLFFALVALGIVLLVIWAVRASTRHGSPAGSVVLPGGAGHHEAVAIAKRRLASGEITKEQYDEIMTALGG